MAFPAPGEAAEQPLDLNQHLVKHPAATFFMKVKETSSNDDEIHAGDLLVVDRSLRPSYDSMIVAVLDGELFVGRAHRIEQQIKSQNGNHHLSGQATFFEIWGVVTNIIRSVY
jgi:DNA polymerase V